MNGTATDTAGHVALGELTTGLGSGLVLKAINHQYSGSPSRTLLGGPTFAAESVVTLPRLAQGGLWGPLTESRTVGVSSEGRGLRDQQPRQAAH